MEQREQEGTMNTSWEPTEAEPYMKVGPLRALLATLPDDMLIVLSKDGEGNGYSPLSDTSDPTTTVYEADSTWSGEIVDTDDLDDDGPVSPDAVPCLVLWPVN